MFHLTLSPIITNIFEGFCILKREDEIKCLFSFPSTYSLEKYYEFIFPCDCPKEKSEEYCVVISNASCDRSFLLCKYLDIQQIYLCIYSFNPWFEIFSKLLFNLSHNDFMPDQYQKMESYLQKIYSANEKFQVTLPPCHANDQIGQHILKCSLNFPYTYDKYIQEYLTAINPTSSFKKQLWLEIFCSMLLERPIIFMSKRFQKLTSSLLAATFFIHPLSWTHKFISIVPRKKPELLGMNCCMLGIHKCMEPLLEKIEFWNEALLVDLDSGDSKMVGACENEKETHDRFKIPKCIKKFFIRHIQMVDDTISSNSPPRILDLISNTPWSINPEEIMFNDYKKGFHMYPLLFRTIIAMLIGNYRQFISLNEKGCEFEKDRFIQCNPKLSDFLTVFVHSQCFDSFIEEKLKCLQYSRDMNDRFDRERLEISIKTKNSNHKIKESKIFSKNSFSRSLKTNVKGERIEKILTMPNPKKPKKVREKRSQTTFHHKSQSLSSSRVSINSNSNRSQDNLADYVSDNSGSLKFQKMATIANFDLIADKYQPCHLSTIGDQEDILVTSISEKCKKRGSNLIDCNLSKSENMLSDMKPPRPLFKPGEGPSGRFRNNVQQIQVRENTGGLRTEANNKLTTPQKNPLDNSSSTPSVP